jgi:hypothetical protein
MAAMKTQAFPQTQLSRAVLVASLTLVGLLGGALPAAAQPGGPCTIVSDATIAPAHAIQSVQLPTLESCAVRDDAGNPDISIMHITGPIDTTGLPLPGQADASAPAIESAPVDGFGDSAKLLRLPVGDGDGTLLMLRVQRGSEVFGFNTLDGPDSPARLLDLAKKVLG